MWSYDNMFYMLPYMMQNQYMMPQTVYDAMMPGQYQMPNTPSGLEEYTYPQNVPGALKLIQEALDGETEDRMFYQYLIEKAPSAEDKEIIMGIRDDEIHHFSLFRQIYYQLTGQTLLPPQNVTFEKPSSYCDGVQRALKGEQNAVRKYRAIKEQRIRKTIEEHLNKELVLNKLGIKVLSLFFIDRVANYRYYDEDGNPRKGIYAKLFEKHYNDLIRQPKYSTLFKDIDLDTAAEEVHNGYFSADKKGVYKDTSGSTQDDEDTHNLIMKDKELLLSFDTKLRFIFSHSALREGWDNPNAFQICTLNETKSEVKKRQEIGRGLRLCVNQEGEHQYGSFINTLTVIANESYEEFAAALQKEYETESGIRSGVIETHLFANIPVKQDDGSIKYLGQAASEAIFKAFLENGYIDESGEVKEKLKIAIKDSKLNVPKEYEHVKAEITALAGKVCSGLNIKNNSDKKTIKLNKQVYLDPEFKELWDRIKYKTTYSVDFDSKKLIDECCREMQRSLFVSSPKLIYTKAGLDISAGGIVAEESDRYAVALDNQQENLPDIIELN